MYILAIILKAAFPGPSSWAEPIAFLNERGGISSLSTSGERQMGKGCLRASQQGILLEGLSWRASELPMLQAMPATRLQLAKGWERKGGDPPLHTCYSSAPLRLCPQAVGLRGTRAGFRIPLEAAGERIRKWPCGVGWSSVLRLTRSLKF